MQKRFVALILCLILLLSQFNASTAIAKGEKQLEDKVKSKVSGELSKDMDSSELVYVVVELEPDDTHKNIWGKTDKKVKEIKEKYKKDEKTIQKAIKSIGEKCGSSNSIALSSSEYEDSIGTDDDNHSDHIACCPEDKELLSNLRVALDDVRNKMKREIGQEVYELTSVITESITEDIQSLGGTITSSSGAMSGVLKVNIPGNVISQLAANEKVKYVHPHKEIKVNVDMKVSAYAVNAPAAWNSGWATSYADVAILDTGIDEGHPALKNRWNGQLRNFIDVPLYDCDDTYGHGTHVAGIVAQACVSDNIKGVAYDMPTIINGKMIMATWNGDLEMWEYTIDPFLAMDVMYWAVGGRLWGLQDLIPDAAEVLSCSWGWDYDNFDIEPWIEERLVDTIDFISDTFDVLFVFAAGNDGGDGAHTLGMPGDAYNTICVGAIDDQDTTQYACNRSDDVIADFSSIGPTWRTGPNTRQKPEIVAPGVSILSTYYNHQWPWDPDFIKYSGTSMAAPHVAAAAAMLMDQGLSSLEAKAVLFNTAEKEIDDWSITCDTTAPNYDVDDLWDARYGYGYMDLAPTTLQKNYVVSIEAPEAYWTKYKGNMSLGDTVTVVYDRQMVGFDGMTGGSTVSQVEVLLKHGGNIWDISNRAIENVQQVYSDRSRDDVEIWIRVNWSDNDYPEDLAIAFPNNSFYDMADPPPPPPTCDCPWCWGPPCPVVWCCTCGFCGNEWDDCNCL